MEKLSKVDVFLVSFGLNFEMRGLFLLFSSGLFDEIFTIVWLQDLLATPMHEDSPGCKWIGAASSNTISSGTTYRAIWSPSKLIMGRTLHRAFLLLFSL